MLNRLLCWISECQQPVLYKFGDYFAKQINLLKTLTWSLSTGITNPNCFGEKRGDEAMDHKINLLFGITDWKVVNRALE